MNIEIINKLDEVIDLIKNDKDYIEFKRLEKVVLSNKELLDKINKLKTIDKYDNNYLKLKTDILNNKDYKDYKRLENEFYLFIKEINNKLNSLKETSCCR